MITKLLTTSLLLAIATKTSALPSAINKPNTRATTPPPTNPYLTHAHTAITRLQTFYNTPSPGFWSAGWWNSANTLTLLADLRAQDSSPFLTALTDGPNGVFQHTLNSQHVDASTGALAYDDFFDDELWWVIALLKTYDVTGNKTFLATANASFATVTLNDRAADNLPCGGLANAYPAEKYLVKSSTIATVLYVEAAALLSTRLPLTQKTTLLNLAKTQWNWLNANILIDGIMQGDALTASTCNNNHAFLTYIEGATLNALVALYQATNNQTYLATADTLATILLSGKHGMMNATTKIVEEYCDADDSCNPDTAQFKGIMMRGLRTLRDAKPDAANGQIKAFLLKNADSFWSNSRQAGTNLLGQKWAGPFTLGTSQALQLSSHSSATMAMVSAALANM
jgi:predicted alpha-1,6-mannanase (GH76 family)